MKRPAIICARGGSKGVVGKNLRRLRGQPLIAWTVAQAAASDLFSHVVVSSDSADILDAASEAGADLLIERPVELATDEISVHPAILHSLAELEGKHGDVGPSFVLLQTTSPLRQEQDILSAVSIWDDHRPGSVVTVIETKSSPYFNLLESTPDGGYALSKAKDAKFDRRQDLPKTYSMNGAVYVFDTSTYRDDPQVIYEDTRICVMPPERSFDIDTELDWKIVEMLAASDEDSRKDVSPVTKDHG